MTANNLLKAQTAIANTVAKMFYGASDGERQYVQKQADKLIGLIEMADAVGLTAVVNENGILEIIGE